jgi:hypothetical protein
MGGFLLFMGIAILLLVGSLIWGAFTPEEGRRDSHGR